MHFLIDYPLIVSQVINASPDPPPGRHAPRPTPRVPPIPATLPYLPPSGAKEASMARPRKFVPPDKVSMTFWVDREVHKHIKLVSIQDETLLGPTLEKLLRLGLEKLQEGQEDRHGR